MIKKLLLTGAIFVASASGVCAGAPYIGVSAGERTNTATTTNYRGMPANLFVGYGADLNQGFYLGGEIFFSPATATIKDDGLKTTYEYGASLIPGLVISDRTMAFARLGLVRTRFTPKGVSDKTVSGAQFGLGIQTNLMQSWDLRAEYIYSDYNSLAGIQGPPRTDAFELGLVYKFD
jgi:opacity protein-like surface antigen